jgi:hypothetical protein
MSPPQQLLLLRIVPPVTCRHWESICLYTFIRPTRAAARSSQYLGEQRPAEAGRPGGDGRPANQPESPRALRSTLAGDAARIPEAEVRATLIRDADAMTVRLGGQPSAAGGAANGGKPLTGTGRLPGDATVVPKGRQAVGPRATGRAAGRPRTSSEEAYGTRPREGGAFDRCAAAAPGHPAAAHGDKVKLDVAGDGANGVTVLARYDDGHPVDDRILRLLLTGTGDGGRRTGPIQLNPATEGLRYCVLHVPARLTRGQRKRKLRIPRTWPWAEQVAAAFVRIQAIPGPG